jgi:hypothetical protein
MELSCDHATPCLGVYSRESYYTVEALAWHDYCETVHNSQTVESDMVPISEWMV